MSFTEPTTDYCWNTSIKVRDGEWFNITNFIKNYGFIKYGTKNYGLANDTTSDLFHLCYLRRPVKVIHMDALYAMTAEQACGHVAFMMDVHWIEMMREKNNEQ